MLQRKLSLLKLHERRTMLSLEEIILLTNVPQNGALKTDIIYNTLKSLDNKLYNYTGLSLKLDGLWYNEFLNKTKTGIFTINTKGKEELSLMHKTLQKLEEKLYFRLLQQ